MQDSLLPNETLARPAHYLQTGQNSKVWPRLEPTFCLMTHIKWARKYRPDQNQSYSTKLQSQVKVNLCVKTKLCHVFVILALFWLIESIHLITVPCIDGFLWTGGTAKLISLVVFHLILQFLPTMAEGKHNTWVQLYHPQQTDTTGHSPDCLPAGGWNPVRADFLCFKMKRSVQKKQC